MQKVTDMGANLRGILPLMSADDLTIFRDSRDELEHIGRAWVLDPFSASLIADVKGELLHRSRDFALCAESLQQSSGKFLHEWTII